MPGKHSSFDDMVSGPDGGSDEVAQVSSEEMSSAASSRVYTDAPDFEDGEVTYPRLRLAQGLTQEVIDGNAKQGQWVLLGAEPMSEVTFIPMAFARARALRSTDQERSIRCQSPDAILGYGEFGPGSKANPTGHCKACPMSQWKPDPANPSKNLPAPCVLTFSYIGYSMEHDQVVSLDLSRSSMNAARYINTLIKGRGMRKFAVRLKGANIKGARGTFAQPQVQFTSVSSEVLDRAAAAMGLAVEGDEARAELEPASA